MSFGAVRGRHGNLEEEKRMTTLTPYLFFGGQCAEALDFYAKALSGRVKQSIPMGEAMLDASPENANRIIHAVFEANGFMFMASDGVPGAPRVSGGQVHLALDFETKEEQERVFANLGEGGEIVRPLHDTFYGGRMGVLTDRYGIQWMLNWSPKPPTA